jgi:hypothetical protein
MPGRPGPRNAALALLKSLTGGRHRALQGGGRHYDRGTLYCQIP